MKQSSTWAALGWVLWIAGCASVSPETQVLTELPDDAGAAPDASAHVPRSAIENTLRTCANGFADCDGRADNGCEADLLADPAHCGACGSPCLDGANGRAVCTRGACQRACTLGYADCDGVGLNGCETFVQFDRNNCGACGTVCSPADVCIGGACSAAPVPAGPAPVQ